MTHLETLLDALADAAYAVKRDHWRIAMNRLRVALAHRTSGYQSIGRRLFLDHSEAKSLLDFAAGIGEKVHKGQRSEERARKRLLQRSVINNEPDLPARFAFIVKPVIDSNGHGRFKIVGPKSADGAFLINYAFWKVANAIPVSRWRTFLPRTCPICKDEYRDGRVVMRGGLLRRCRDCLHKGKRKKK